jgi:hypothetical protein
MPDTAFNWFALHLGHGPVAILTLFGLAVVPAWIAYKFFIESIQESTQKYYELKLKLCQEAAKVAAKISTSNNSKEIREAVARFEELYWGELVVVEDSRLASAMVEFRKKIPKRPDQELDLKELVTLDDRGDLRNATLDISVACFNMLQPRWIDVIIRFLRPFNKKEM